MTFTVKPLAPIKVKINFWNKCKLFFLACLSILMWIVLIIAGASVVAYYTYVIWTKGFFDAEALKFALLLIIGAYFFITLDKRKIDECLNIKRDLPFITIEQRKTK